MSKFAVTPMYKSSTARYNAPTFFVEEKEEVRNSALSRFPEWHFNIIEVSKGVLLQALPIRFVQLNCRMMHLRTFLICQLLQPF